MKTGELSVRSRSRAACGTNKERMERVTGIEPAWPAWKAGALPLSYTREPIFLRLDANLDYRIISTTIEQQDRGVA